MASSTCLPTSDRIFGPRVDPFCRTFDFTLLFEDIFFACLPTAVFFSLLPFHVTVLAKSPVVCSVRSKLLLGKLATLAGIFMVQVIFLILRSQKTVVQTSVSLTADSLTIFGIFGVVWLSYMDHQRSLRPSTLLSLYLSMLVILDIARVRTLWLIGSARGEAAAMTVILILTVAALLLESTEKRSSVTEQKRFGAPEEYSGFWTRTAFAWLVATFRAGYSKVIVLDDLPILDTRLRSNVLRENIVNTWAKCKYPYDHRARYSLIKACFHAYLFSFLSGIPPRLCKTVFYFTQPLLINTTVSYVADASADMNFGRALIGAWALVFLGIACSTALFSYQTTRFITRIKGGLIGLVYQETLKARTIDLGETTAIALMGTDVERIGQNLQSIHEIWASIIEIGVAIWLLEQQVFLACLAPVAVIVISIGVTVPMSNSVRKAQVAWIEMVQERLRITSTMLDDMKAVKMLGVSSIMSEIIQKLRQVEIQTSKVYRKLLLWNVLLSECPQNISPMATFAVYVIIALYWKNASLLTAQAFTAIALINLLTTPVLQLVQIMPQLLQCVSSFERIQEYCNFADDAAEYDESSEPSIRAGSSISLQSLSRIVSAQSENDHKQAIILENSNFTRDKSKTPFLKDIDLRVPIGSFTVCVGAVGSGKSMLLESILGETISSLGPAPNRTSSIAYCAQQPWLEKGMIQSIIFGISQYDSKWYKTVKSACSLDADLQTLERRDKTVIGSKGLNLSGGQKQRIALARAVYSRKDVVVLDDVFSGMDAHTVDLISRQLLGKDGLFRKRGTTVILATHSHKLMSFADTIVALEDGRITEVGSPQALLSHEGYVAKLGLVLRDEEPIREHAEDTEISPIERTVTESSISVPLTTDQAVNALDARRKNGDWSVYSYYLASSGYKIIIMFFISMGVWIFCTEFATVWLDWWSEANEIEANKNLGMYMGVYAFFCIFGVAAIAISCWIGLVNIISNSAFVLHSDLLVTTMKAPLRFFTTTDTGTLTNRFSQDMELIDMSLPLIMINYIATGFAALAKAIILIVFSQYLATMAPFVVTLLYFLQSFYLQTSRQVRLLEIEAKAPLYTHFIESVAGAPTIRAFGWQSQYQERNYKFIDQAQRPAYLQSCIQHWLGIVLDMLITAIAVVLVAIIVTWKNKFSAGNVGVSLVMVMTFSSVLMRLIKMWTMMESSIGAVARVKRFVAETESEERSGWKAEVAQDWPTQGNIEFKSLVAAHSPSAEPVIKGISLSIRPSEHVALCGRSGSGKTSAILALLQMIETQRGQITVDGVDASTMSCTDLRSHLNVVPQDPFLVPGTIRFNIDPFRKVSDEDIIRALERVRLWSIISKQGGLGEELDTAAWSAGQKQLLCLARAMVRNSKVLILDEATSSVDSETEAIMQDIIDTIFRDCTVLAVMHRLTHVTRYDKVALLDDGHLVEFDAPEILLSQESRFARLYQTSATRP
ncbi:ABC transporter [Xylariales sp. AK1849]|nr:ABC transporter [Xylariales sp. AK1849]